LQCAKSEAPGTSGPATSTTGDCVLFIHGFNTELNALEAQTQELMAKLGRCVVAFSWLGTAHAESAGLPIYSRYVNDIRIAREMHGSLVELMRDIVVSIDGSTCSS